MNQDFQDREDTDKRAQMALTQYVIAALASREGKLKALRNFRYYYFYRELQELDACTNYCRKAVEEEYSNGAPDKGKATEAQRQTDGENLSHEKEKNIESSDSIEQKE